MSTRVDIDGFRDGVDFDDNYKLALDGQRLLLKSGVYWADGSTYMTEYKSNVQIELKITGQITYFVVTNPDGSRAWYGSAPTTLQNSVSLNAWYIMRFEDVYGNSIQYEYQNYVYNSINQLYIKKIYFSGNSAFAITSKNYIEFNYSDAARVERDFLKGQAVYASKILDNIKVYTTNDNIYALFRRYQLTQTNDDYGYQRVTQIQEFNSNGDGANLVKFDYNNTVTDTERIEIDYSNTIAENQIKMNGDFDGDGHVDFVAGNELYTNIFQGGGTGSHFSLPFWHNERTTLTATTLLANKMNQKQSIVETTETLNSISFNVHNFSGITNQFQLGYTKTIPFDNVLFHITGTPDCGSRGENRIKTSNEYLEGDFNGDGISEVLITKTKNEKYNFYEVYHWETYDDGWNQNSYQVFDHCDYQTTDDGKENYLFNLTQNASITLGDSGFVKLTTNNDWLKGDKKFVMDFNGDSKADILVMTGQAYKVIGFKQLIAAPWVELELLGEGYLPHYATDKPTLFGDYNGDGKVDIMIPVQIGSWWWSINYSNPKPNSTDFFKYEEVDIVPYVPSIEFAKGGDYNKYYALDVNKDGKTDLIEFFTSKYTLDWHSEDVDTLWRLRAFTNKIGITSGFPFPKTYDSDIGRPYHWLNASATQNHFSGSPEMPFGIASNFKYAGANTEFLVVRSHDRKVEYYRFNKDFNKDNQLKSVTESLGNIKNEIFYKTMEPSGANNGLGNGAIDFYSSTNSVTYPNVELIKNPNSYLVSMVKATVNGASKYQRFKYQGLVSNFEYGSVGFIRTARSSWFLTESDSKIWSINYNDPTIKGANTKAWSNTDEASVFNAIPSYLLSSKENIFETYTDPTTKQYNVLLKKQIDKDNLTQVRTETTNTYDGLVNSSTAFGLKTIEQTEVYLGTDLNARNVAFTAYNNNAAGIGNQYYIGRPQRIFTRKLIYPNNTALTDTRTSIQSFTYTGFNLTNTYKLGYLTVAVHEDMSYDDFGNLLTKTVSVPTPTAGTPAVAARTITDAYDTTKRFVIKKIDHQGFVTFFDYNSLGQVKYSKNPFGVENTILYDYWGKQTQSTTNGASSSPVINYTRYNKMPDGGYTTTSSSNADPNTNTTQVDVLGRTIKTTTKGFAAPTLIAKQIVYDGLGHKQKESEPYFTSTTPARWSTYSYDYLNRPITIITPTGRVQQLQYDGLTTTSVDDGKLTTATMDAIGNKVQTTDPGGTINFSFYANGQLKESNYGGHKINIKIDGWGNKIEMKDPNAGTYSYAFDDFGQSIKETTPKGTTSFKYDDFGKFIEKIVQGDGANYTSRYTYNQFAQLTQEQSRPNGRPINGSQVNDTFSYTYDSLHRPETTTEENNNFTHKKTIEYNPYGKLKSETNYTKALTSALENTTVARSNYNSYNGMMDKLTDANNSTIWQLNGANEKMQALTAVLGNGVTINNSYDVNGYFTKQQHSRYGGEDVLNNTYSFNGIKGTLNYRQNNVLNVGEIFGYDNLDRLTQWSVTNGILINCPFNSGVEGFSYFGNNTGSISNATTGTYAQKLKVYAVGLKPGVEKQILSGATIGTRIKIEVDFEKISSNTPINILIIEKNGIDPDTSTYIGDVTTGHFEYYYSVKNNSEVYFKIQLKNISRNNIGDTGLLRSANDALALPPNGVTNGIGTFYIDNFIVKNLLTKTQTYDDRGRITTNEIGSYNYNPDLATGIYKKQNIQLSQQGNALYANKPLQVVTYNMFKSPMTINESSTGATNFEYNSHQSRTTMDYGYNKRNFTYTKNKYYTDDDSTEILVDNVKNTTTIRSYMGGDAYTAPMYIDKVLDTNGVTTENKFYLHRDYLGSIIAITNASGTAVEQRHFDAWGNLTQLKQNGINIVLPVNGGDALMMLDRGYTSHEHLSEVGLIHMNGRLYDPTLHTFLMPDNFVQQPENTQNYNRYAYVLNNPLMYTDPSGEFIPILVAIAIGAAVAALTYTAMGMVNGTAFSWSAFAMATFIGAATAAVTFGVGTAAASMFTQVAANFLQGAMQGAVIGGLTGITGVIANAAFSGGLDNLTLNAVLGGALIGAATGAIIGGIQGGIRAQKADANFWTGNKTLDTSQGVGAHTAEAQKIVEQGSIKAKFAGKFEDVNVFESKLISGNATTSGGLTLPPNKIALAKGAYANIGKNNWITDLIHHEFGHILEYRQPFVGMGGYYNIIAPESAASNAFGSTFANNYWTETWANHLSSKYFNYNFFNPGIFPIQNISTFNQMKLTLNWYSNLPYLPSIIR